MPPAMALRSIDDHSCEALARVHISEINERLGLHLPEDEHFDTIGGFVFHQLGRIPHVGEELTFSTASKSKCSRRLAAAFIRVAIEVLAASGNEIPEEASSESRRT